MRNLSFVLVLANLGFAAWYFWFNEPATEVRRAGNTDVPSIALVSELEELPSEPAATAEVVPSRAADIPAPPAVASIAPAERCVGIGPFSQLDRFDAAMTILRAAAYDPVQRTENGDVWLGYWVYLENVTTQGQADTLGNVLAETGIQDTYFDPSGLEGDVLSLGLFREFARAEALRELALAAGFEAVMADRTRPGTLYWADLVLAIDEELELEPLQAAGRIIRMDPRPCDEPDATPVPDPDPL